jgi:arginyl-tRNA synthetase
VLCYNTPLYSFLYGGNLSEFLPVKQKIIESIQQRPCRRSKPANYPASPPDISSSIHKSRTRDYATPAQKLAHHRQNPLGIAKNIAAFIFKSTEIADVTVAPPGFINFTLSQNWLTERG